MRKAKRQLQAHAEVVAPADVPASGSYLTNERRLLRVLGQHAGSDDGLVEVEDCSTLDVWLLEAEELAPLRQVRLYPMA